MLLVVITARQMRTSDGKNLNVLYQTLKIDQRQNAWQLLHSFTTSEEKISHSFYLTILMISFLRFQNESSHATVLATKLPAQARKFKYVKLWIWRTSIRCSPEPLATATELTPMVPKQLTVWMGLLWFRLYFPLSSWLFESLSRSVGRRIL